MFDPNTLKIHKVHYNRQISHPSHLLNCLFVMFKPYGDFYRFLPQNMTGYHHMHLYHTADHAPLEKYVYY